MRVTIQGYHHLWLLLFLAEIGMLRVKGLAPSPRVALISGANKGIGKEIVRRLLLLDSSDNNSRPWIILLGSRDEELGNKAVQELLEDPNNRNNNKDTTRIICCPLDLTDHDSIEAAKELVVLHGGGKLDVLINNAAICFNDPTLYGKVPHTPFEQQANITVQTNFFGTLKLTRTMLPLLLSSSKSNDDDESTTTIPRIINIASAAGRLAILKSDALVRTFTSEHLQLDGLESLMRQFVHDVEAGIHKEKGWPNTCYGMSKLGIIAMTKILAREYHPNNNNNMMTIMVNSVDPGYCATDQNDHQGYLPAARGAVTPCMLANLPTFVTGKHFFQEQEIAW
jgi:carbonyl reductase 1